MVQKAAKTSVLKPDEVETIVRDWFRYYSEKNFDAHNALIHPDAIVSYPEMCFTGDPDRTAGKAFLVKTLEKDEKAFIDLKMKIENLWVVGDTAFVEGYFLGSKLGGSINDSAKGAGMRTRFLHRIDIQDRMIKVVYSYYDTALFYQIQLGVQGPTKENPIPPWMKAMSAEK